MCFPAKMCSVITLSRATFSSTFSVSATSRTHTPTRPMTSMAAQALDRRAGNPQGQSSNFRKAALPSRNRDTGMAINHPLHGT